MPILLDLSYQSILHHITNAENDKRNERENKTPSNGDHNNVVTLQNVIDKKKQNSFTGANNTSGSTGDDGTTNTTTNDVVKIFEKELCRLATTIMNERQNLEVNARILLTTCDETLSLETTTTNKKPLVDDDNERGKRSKAVCDEEKKSIETLYRAACDISKTTIALNQFVTRNATLLRQLAKEADEKLSTSLFSKLIQTKLSATPWTIGDGIIIIILSDVYSVIREARQRRRRRDAGDDGDNEWVAPNSFQRKTKKYFVKDENISQVLHALVRRAPLLVYGRSGRLTPQHKDDAAAVGNGSNGQSASSHSFTITGNSRGGDYLWDELISPVTSIYFDSHEMSMYSHRIARDEGAQLFRVRWYGSEQPSNGAGRTTSTDNNAKSTSNDTVFFELKTHHERWVDSRSTKERVAVKYRDVGPFLSLDDGTTTTKSSSDNDEKKIETMDDIRRMASAATRTKKKKSSSSRDDHRDDSKSINLLCEMHELIHKNNLIPCTRTTYDRVACQSSKSNDLRFTLDRNITLFDERRYFLEGEKWWCTTDFSSVDVAESIEVLPRAVLEVKIGGRDDVGMRETVAFVEELIGEGLIEEVDKFSKYLTGAAVFNEVKVVPYWANFDSLSSLFDKRSSSSSKNAGSCSNSMSKMSKSDRIVDSFLTTKNNSFLVPTTTTNHESDVTTTTLKYSDEDETLTTLIIDDDNTKRVVSSLGDSSLENNSDGDNNNDPIDSRNKFLQFFFPHNNKPPPNDDPIVAQRKPPKVAPKTFMANERTFISWVGTSATIFTLSQILIGQGTHQSWVAGMVITSLSLLMVVYAMYIYFRRLHLLQNTNVGARYKQKFGPMFLGLALIVAISVTLLFGSTATVDGDSEGGGGGNGEGDDNGGGVAGMMHPMEERDGECVRKRIKGFSMLKYEPSDILVVEERNIMLATSLESIIVLSKEKAADDEEMNVGLVLNINGENFKGLTIVDDTIYALSSSDDEDDVVSSSFSKLFACRWNDNDDGLTVINSWDIPTPGAKAITYVPYDDGHGIGRLYIAGNVIKKDLSRDNEGNDDIREEISIMHAYDVPTLSVNNNTTTTTTTTQHHDKLMPYYKMNENAFSYGLDQKDGDGHHNRQQISSMQYFENILFLLHDSSGTIRAWDLENGSLLAEWKINTPNVTAGAVHNRKGVDLFRKRRWKGMGLQWNTAVKEINRGGLTTKSYKHIKKLASLSSSPIHHMLRGSFAINDKADFSTLRVVPSKKHEELLIHFALDMPPQIWTIVIKLNDDDDGGDDFDFSTASMKIPECSGMKNTGLSFFMD